MPETIHISVGEWNQLQLRIAHLETEVSISQAQAREWARRLKAAQSEHERLEQENARLREELTANLGR